MLNCKKRGEIHLAFVMQTTTPFSLEAYFAFRKLGARRHAEEFHSENLLLHLHAV